jgi:hypothetical protein
MFEDRETTAAAPKPAPPKTEAAASDIVIHTMPKEFYDREVKLRDEATPRPAVPPPVAPPPQPAVVAPARPVLKPTPQPSKKRSRTRVIIVLAALILLLGAGAAAYVYTQGLFDNPGQVTPNPQPTPEPEPAPTPPPQPPKPVSGADTDSDGLTNVEELLYGTDFRNPDSDGDTFLDGNEVFHRFDPIGLAPSTLLDTGSVRVLESLELPFTMFYPTTWNPVSTPASQRVTFRAATGASITILWQDKNPNVDLEGWYESSVDDDTSRLQTTITKEGYTALIEPDERVMYIEGTDKAYTVMYDLGDTLTIEFLQTFKMMVNSFKLVP